jgi:hypothetical protein
MRTPKPTRSRSVSDWISEHKLFSGLGTAVLIGLSGFVYSTHWRGQPTENNSTEPSSASTSPGTRRSIDIGKAPAEITLLSPAPTNSPPPKRSTGAVRMITTEQRRVLQAMFGESLFAKPELLILHTISDPKAQALAIDIANVATESGIAVELRPCRQQIPDGLALTPPSLDLTSGITVIAKALTQARLSFEWTTRADLHCLGLIDDGKVVLSVGPVFNDSRPLPSQSRAQSDDLPEKTKENVKSVPPLEEIEKRYSRMAGRAAEQEAIIQEYDRAPISWIFSVDHPAKIGTDIYLYLKPHKPTDLVSTAVFERNNSPRIFELREGDMVRIKGILQADVPKKRFRIQATECQLVLPEDSDR